MSYSPVEVLSSEVQCEALFLLSEENSAEQSQLTPGPSCLGGSNGAAYADMARVSATTAATLKLKSIVTVRSWTRECGDGGSRGKSWAMGVVDSPPPFIPREAPATGDVIRPTMTECASTWDYPTARRIPTGIMQHSPGSTPFEKSSTFWICDDDIGARPWRVTAARVAKKWNSSRGWVLTVQRQQSSSFNNASELQIPTILHRTARRFRFISE